MLPSRPLPMSLRRPALMLLLLPLLAGGAAAASVKVTVQDATGKPLPDAVVFLESPAARAASKPARGIEVAQVDKQFAPQVVVVPVGSAVEFPNRDKVRHHVYSFSPAKNFELKLYAGTPANPVVFDKTGVAVLGCNIHDQMAAWVVVVDTPHYGRTNAAGAVSIDDVPVGNYRLRTWHAGQPVGAAAADQPLVLAAAGASINVRLQDVTR